MHGFVQYVKSWSAHLACNIEYYLIIQFFKVCIQHIKQFIRSQPNNNIAIAIYFLSRNDWFMLLKLAWKLRFWFSHFIIHYMLETAWALILKTWRFHNIKDIYANIACYFLSICFFHSFKKTTRRKLNQLPTHTAWFYLISTTRPSSEQIPNFSSQKNQVGRVFQVLNNRKNANLFIHSTYQLGMTHSSSNILSLHIKKCTNICKNSTLLHYLLSSTGSHFAISSNHQGINTNNQPNMAPSFDDENSLFDFVVKKMAMVSKDWWIQ